MLPFLLTTFIFIEVSTSDKPDTCAKIYNSFYKSHCYATYSKFWILELPHYERKVYYLVNDIHTLLQKRPTLLSAMYSPLPIPTNIESSFHYPTVKKLLSSFISFTSRFLILLILNMLHSVAQYLNTKLAILHIKMMLKNFGNWKLQFVQESNMMLICLHIVLLTYQFFTVTKLTLFSKNF